MTPVGPVALRASTAPEALLCSSQSHIIPGNLEVPRLTSTFPLSAAKARTPNLPPSALQAVLGPIEAERAAAELCAFDWILGAGDGIRTREYQLGRLMPYHLATPARF